MRASLAVLIALFALVLVACINEGSLGPRLARTRAGFSFGTTGESIIRDDHHISRSHSPVYTTSNSLSVCAVGLSSYQWENSDAQDQLVSRLS